MISIYIFAYPMQATVIQVYIEQEGVLTPIDNAICMYADIVNIVRQFINKHSPKKYVIAGIPSYYNHIKKQLENVFDIEIEEVEND